MVCLCRPYADHIPLNFLKAVFHKVYLVHSGILIRPLSFQPVFVHGAFFFVHGNFSSEIFRSCYSHQDYLQKIGFNFGQSKRCQSSLSLSVFEDMYRLNHRMFSRMFSQANQLFLFAILSLADFCQQWTLAVEQTH